MKYFRKYIIPFTLFISLVAFFGCKDNWDDHAKFKQYYSDITLLDKIKQDPELSKFVQYLQLTGYDQLLASAQSFTVWAPKNDLFAGLDTTYAIADDVTSVSDTIKLKRLKLFVSNHICNQELGIADLKTMARIKNLSGKNLILSNQGSKIEESDVVSADQYCNNGVLHIVSRPLTPKMNIWEYLMSSKDAETFRNYIQQYNVKVFDRANSTPIRVLDGKFIVYDSVFAKSNSFLLQYGRMDVEDSLYTFVILTNDALQAEKDRFITYFTSSTPKKTDSLVYWNIYKDFVFNGKYERDNAPSVLVSTDSVQVPFDKNAVLSTYHASNGIVYVMNSCSVAFKNKLKPIIIDPNYTDCWVSTNNTDFYQRGSTNISGSMSGYIKNRRRALALNGYDFMFSGYASTSGKDVVMFPTALYSNMKYKLYWTAVNDFQTAPIAQSMSLIGNLPTFIPSDSIRFIPVPTQQDFNREVYLGEGSSNLYGNYNIKVYSGYSAASSITPIVLNYIKIVPVVE